MRTRVLLYFLLVVLLVGGAGAWGLLHLQNARTRERIAALRLANDEASRLRAESERARQLLATAASGEEAAARAIHDDVLRLRREIAELEQRAAAGRARLLARNAADAAALAHNRDAIRGLVRAENATRAGQSTPASAFQTLVWAAMKGDDAALAQTVAVTGAAREKAEAIIAGLPEEARAKWPTPEKLAALFFAHGLLEELQAFEIMDETLSDAQHATLRLRMPGQAKEPQLRLELQPHGWAVVIPEKQIDQIRARLAGAPPGR